MRQALFVGSLLVLTACHSRSSSEAATLRDAAKACGIEHFQSERVFPERDRQAQDSSSPLRQIGRWWVERRERRSGVKPIYQTNVHAVCGGFSAAAARERRLRNGQFDCLATWLATSGIEVRPTCTFDLE
jgi:hypothetical protein